MSCQCILYRHYIAGIIDYYPRLTINFFRVKIWLILIIAWNLSIPGRRAGIMRMSEFEMLRRKDQLAILRREGIYIGKRKMARFINLLFQLDSFYVEIIYVSYRLSIHKIRYSDSAAILDPYLDQIEVEYLVA